MSGQVPCRARIVRRIQESPTIFTLGIELLESNQRKRFSFTPGQFNMVYLYGAGEVPISIVSDPEDETMLDHTIRVVGRVTRGLALLKEGDEAGIRGPFGRGWPLDAVHGKDVLIITGGLGCAPVISVINYILRRRADYGRLTILQGVKHSEDLIWRQRYERWIEQPDIDVRLAADVGTGNWPWYIGRVTALLDGVEIDAQRTIVMMCGPELMMARAVGSLASKGIPGGAIWMSMERNMHCGNGLCGHCQLGPKFVCREGPVFQYPEIESLLAIRGV
ncbi:MAG: FAD/NAD(P)-binding protein [Pseudomonadota bacterium]|nr:MAG: FAD/NAD(P)-binding protein [Pseudomonadota bacterium]